MAEVLDVVNAFTPPLKVAWVVWIAWGVAQVFWYRHERKPHVAARKPAAAPARKPFISRPANSERLVTRLVTPDVITPQGQPAAPAGVAPVEGNQPARIGELDQFVADFEMNTRHRRGEPHNGEPYNAQIGG